MRIWIDSDACPRPAKELVFRASIRMELETRVVCNSPQRMPQSNWILQEVVEKGFDKADDHIAESVEKGDLVITADIPLAARIVDRGALGLDPRGIVYNPDNVKEKLATRNLLADLRDTGMVGTGPGAYSDKDRNRFASALNQLLTKLIKL